MAVGQTFATHFTYDVVDEHGARVTQHATVTITGTNDAPTVSAEVTGGGAEGSGTTSVNLLDFATDVDNGAVLHVENVIWNEVPGNMPAGFTLVGNSIEVDTSSLAYDAMPAGSTFTTHFTYDVVDEHGAHVTQHATITITGTNDGATIAGTATGTVQEDVAVVSGNLSTSGDLAVADVDSGEAVFQAQAGTAGSNGYGTFTLEANGHWTYTVDNGQAAVQGLAIDEFLTDSFTAVSADGTASETVTVTINGSNDVIYTADGTVDPSAQKPNGMLLVGSGIPSTHFGLANQTDVGVELGLQIIYRSGPTVTTTDTMPTASCTSLSTTARSRPATAQAATRSTARPGTSTIRSRPGSTARPPTSTTSPSSCCSTSIPPPAPATARWCSSRAAPAPRAISGATWAPEWCSSPMTPATPTSRRTPRIIRSRSSRAS